MRYSKRGFTLVELVIVVFILVTITLGIIAFIGRSGGSMDMREQAKNWRYEVLGANCSNIDSDIDSYVSCALRISEHIHPIALECSILTDQCRLMKMQLNN